MASRLRHLTKSLEARQEKYTNPNTPKTPPHCTLTIPYIPTLQTWNPNAFEKIHLFCVKHKLDVRGKEIKGEGHCYYLGFKPDLVRLALDTCLGLPSLALSCLALLSSMWYLSRLGVDFETIHVLSPLVLDILCIL